MRGIHPDVVEKVARSYEVVLSARLAHQIAASKLPLAITIGGNVERFRFLTPEQAKAERN